MNRYNREEILTLGERLTNIIYYIFRYSLYAIAWVVIVNTLEEFWGLLLVSVFCYLSYMVQQNKQKVLEKLIAEERYNIEQALINNTSEIEVENK